MSLEPGRKFLETWAMADDLRASRAAGLDQMDGQTWE